MEEYIADIIYLDFSKAFDTVSHYCLPTVICFQVTIIFCKQLWLQVTILNRNNFLLYNSQKHLHHKKSDWTGEWIGVLTTFFSICLFFGRVVGNK